MWMRSGRDDSIYGDYIHYRRMTARRLLVAYGDLNGYKYGLWLDEGILAVHGIYGFHLN